MAVISSWHPARVPSDGNTRASVSLWKLANFTSACMASSASAHATHANPGGSSAGGSGCRSASSMRWRLKYRTFGALAIG
jgi:hypothetical protein